MSDRNDKIKLLEDRQAIDERNAQLAQAREDLKAMRFNFDNLSWGEGQKIAGIQIELQNAQEQSDILAMNAAYAKLRDFLAIITEYLPDDWFITSMQGVEHDFSDPLTYTHIKNTRATRLMIAMAEAQKDASKN